MRQADEDDLWNEAMALLLRWQASPDDAGLMQDVRAFCAKGPAHLKAWNAAKRVYRLTGEVSRAAAEPERKRPAVSRRAILGGLAAVAVAGAAGPGLIRRFGSDLSTGRAEISRRQLDDGSWLVLGPYSTARLRFTPALRQLELLDGLAYCQVASDQGRPFEVRTDRMVATATDAIFEVRRSGPHSLVGVELGSVRVDGLGGDSVLDAGDWIAANDQQLRHGRREADQIAAWRQNLLVADGDPIGAVVAEIGRWRRGEIFIPQSSLAEAPVSGVFDLSDPDTALAAVISPYGGRVRSLSPWVTVLTTG